MVQKNYKGIMVSSAIYPFIKHMPLAEEYRVQLDQLLKNWDNLSLLNELSNSQTYIGDTQQAFSSLISDLLNHLSFETLTKTSNEMAAKAQIAVDIVIRNLYERTADIGFLATDKDIRSFLKNTVSIYDPNYKDGIHALKSRFQEYVAKYSVYYDIVLFTSKGEILLRLDETYKDLSKSKDPLINLVMNTQDDFVESYRYHDFLPNSKQSLVYAYKVTETNDKNSPILGTLALCFRFNDEMKGIFSNLVSTENKECIMLLDNTGKVISSSDPYHIPLDATVEMNLHKPYKLVSFGGREYLAKTCETNGYQGFKGLGWYGHIMVPIEYAFSGENEQISGITKETLLGILQNGESFSDELKNIPKQAERIQKNLNRALWNGSIAQTKAESDNKKFARILLQEIGKIGALTKNIFDASIINLTQTIVLNNTTAISSLMIDIMDRNLYERANDCRWWALTSDFRNIMNKSTIDTQDKGVLTNILSYINGLYTVYSNLFLYDAYGVIIAVSNPNESYLIGRKVSKHWIDQTLQLQNSAHYCVSNFEQSDLYHDDYTYIYNAAIHPLSSDETKALGGIGIVFNSRKEFYEMLCDSLPKNSTGQIKEGVFGLYCTKDKIIISSNNDNHAVGSFFELDDKFFNLSNGESYSEIIIYEGHYYAVGATCSHGYREYKSENDAYQNDVIAIFFSLISDAKMNLSMSSSNFEVFTLPEDIADKMEIGSFWIGNRWLGVNLNDIVETVSVEQLQESLTLDSSFHFKGTLIYKDKVVSVLDLKDFIKDCNGDYSDIVIVKYVSERQERYLGILVHSLGDITEVERGYITPMDKFFVSNGVIMDGIVIPKNSTNNDQALTLLNIEKIGKELVIQTSMSSK